MAGMLCKNKTRYFHLLTKPKNVIYNVFSIRFQDPAKQTNKIVQNPDTNTYTLTQVGAFKKQLQLDQLDFDSKH